MSRSMSALCAQYRGRSDIYHRFIIRKKAANYQRMQESAGVWLRAANVCKDGN